jgi:hypothetical protein
MLVSRAVQFTIIERDLCSIMTAFLKHPKGE